MQNKIKMVSFNTNNEELCVNSRVKVGNDFGTVRFIGEIQGYEGVWIGVEWDNKTRGRHNGTIKGVKYFETKHPTSASMIRQEKIDKYETLASAIEHRYLSSEKDSNINSSLIQELQDSCSASIMEIVGMDKIREKQKHLEFSNDITIEKSTINDAGRLPDLRNLTSLCLKSSCISNWKIVGDILTQIPSLKTLDLSQNRLEHPSDGFVITGKLESLLLNNCGLEDWNDVLKIGELFPNIQTLSLKENDISKIVEADPWKVFKNLKCLILNDNKIRDFKEILKLGNLRSIEDLIMINNQVEEIVLAECDHDVKLEIFPKLESLHIRDNPIKDEMKSFNELDKLPKLEKLSYLSNEANRKNDLTFTYAVGLIDDLKYFNRSKLDKTQKKDAQYDVWKLFAGQWIEVAGNLEEKLKFLKTCRVYEKLIGRYGSPESIIIASKLKKITTIEVQFKNVANGKLYRKKLPLQMSIHTLYGLIYKLTNLGGRKMDSSSFKLYYVDAYNNNIKVYLDNLSKTLDYYSLQNGDTIFIDY